MSDKPIRILLVEDDGDFAQIVRLCLGEPDAMGLVFEIDVATRLGEALQLLAVSRYDAALVDLGLPDASGLESVRAVLAVAPNMPLLVSTNFGDETSALDAVRMGAQDFMIKASTDSRLLKRSIRYAIERKAVLAQRDEIIRAAADGMVVVDASGTVQFLNAAAEAVLGAKAAALLGRPFPHLIKPGDVALVEFARPGGPVSVEMRVTSVSWSDGPACLACLRDVTNLRRVEQLISEVSERRRQDELKDRWIETLSHELRSPLAVIKGAVAELHDGTAGALLPPQEMLVGLAHRQVERVVRMVVHLLDLSRLESGMVEANLQPVDPAEVVRRVAGDFARAAEDRAVRIETDLPPDGIKWAADPDLFEQLLVNLLDNALRFATSRIVVRLRGGAQGVELTVHDDGIGIPAEKRETLFTRFSQLERGKRDGYKGTGLGLAICKEISAMHGGSIGIESEPGAGTAFLVRLPVNGSRAQPPHAASSRSA